MKNPYTQACPPCPPAKAQRSRPAPPGRNGFKYRPQFGLVILCRDEPHQAELHRRLSKDGHRMRVVSV